MNKQPVLFFDTETSNMINFKARNSDPSQPWIVQLAAVLSTSERILSSMNLLIKSEGLPMGAEAEAIHGISVEIADLYGYPPDYAFQLFHSLARRADLLVCHNNTFDLRMLAILARRLEEHSEGVSMEIMEEIKAKPSLCTMTSTTKLCQLPKPSGYGGYKWPKLTELHHFLFNEEFEGAHDALIDVQATRRCYYELKKREVI